MGAGLSSPQQQTGSVVPVITTSIQRTPVLDGASGLHYSGRIYTNPMAQLATGVCDNTGSVSPDQVNDVMPGSISSTTLPMDDNTHRIEQSALNSYIQGLILSGQIPPAPKTDSVDLDKQLTADKQFYQQVQSEYCFYDARYSVALDGFLRQASTSTSTSGSGSGAVDSSLASTIALNTRLNSLLEILNYVANDRGDRVNKRSPQINSANQALQDKIAILQQQQQFLSSSDSKIRTQQEMVRYSNEKNGAMEIQVIFFVALNVVALGTIIAIYKNVRAF